MEKFEKLDNEQKELVKYWMNKLLKERGNGLDRNDLNSFIEKHLTPEPDIEVGKWYITKDNEGNEYMFNHQENGNSYGFNLGVWINGNWWTKFHWINPVKEATPEELDKRIKEYANKIYFGKKLHPLNSDLMSGYEGNGVSISIDTINVMPYYGQNAFWAHAKEWNAVIFCNGKWAEIIDEKAEIRESVERLEAELNELKSKL